MDFSERARNIVLSVIAIALNATVSVVERMLPFRPEWVERIQLLAAEFASVDAAGIERGGGASAPRASVAGSHADAVLPRVEQMLTAYDVLWEFSQKTRVEGLLLDDEFCARVEKEWSTGTLIKFMQTADASLKERAEQAQAQARELMGGGDA